MESIAVQDSRGKIKTWKDIVSERGTRKSA